VRRLRQLDAQVRKLLFDGSAIDVLLAPSTWVLKARHKPVRRRGTPFENAVFVSPIMGSLAKRGHDAVAAAARDPYFPGPGDTRRFAMPLPVSLHLVLVAAAVAVLARPAPAGAQGAAVALAQHRAVYDLKLSSTRGKRAMNAVRGRILYDFSGSACEGYALQFRQVSEARLGRGQGNRLRSARYLVGGGRWQAAAVSFAELLRRSAARLGDGQAERDGDGIAVELKEPGEKKLDMKNELVFPTEHVRRIIAAARDGKTLMQVSVYDGSDTGEKLYDSSLNWQSHRAGPAQAGRRSRRPGGVRGPDALAGDDQLFRPRGGGEVRQQTPVYAITFELYENGVSRALLLDYAISFSPAR